jgi:lipid-binding SYLF domain-containing protein
MQQPDQDQSTQPRDQTTQQDRNTTRSHRAEVRNEAQDQASKAAKVFEEIMNIPEKNIPQTILNGAECVAVFPSVIKGGFWLFGGRYGRGLVSCRDSQTGMWGAPLFLEMKGGSLGPQIGGAAIDLVLLGMNRESASLFTKTKFKLGGEASVAAGPVGREAGASTDLPTIRSQILSYSRSRGLFAGLELKGAVISREKDLNQTLYGLNTDPTRVLTDGVKTPDTVQVFPQTLARFSQRKATTQSSR